MQGRGSVLFIMKIKYVFFVIFSTENLSESTYKIRTAICEITIAFSDNFFFFFKIMSLVVRALRVTKLPDSSQIR